MVLILVLATPGVTQAPALDLSTPEKTVRTFLASFFEGHFKQAVKCVAGGVARPEFDEMESDAKTHPMPQKDKIKIAEVAVTLAGDSATAHVKYAQPLPSELASEEDVPLSKLGDDWKIVPMDLAAAMKLQSDPSAGGKNLPLIRMTTAMFTNSPVFAQARSSARKVSCLSNVKQVSLGLMMFLQDYDEKFALKPVNYKAKIMPYVKNEGIFHCPDDKSGAVSYSFNVNLQGIALAKIKSPAETVMVYEGKGGKLEYRHNGSACVGFADGHAKMVNQTGAKKLRWIP